jgi:hypothetical protein
VLLAGRCVGEQNVGDQFQQCLVRANRSQRAFSGRRNAGENDCAWDGVVDEFDSIEFVRTKRGQFFVRWATTRALGRERTGIPSGWEALRFAEA